MDQATYTYREPPRDLPVLGDWDVVVCGGGPAGCSAAIAAARAGARTLLLEKEGYLGGATVMSLVCVILSTNGVDFQGIWHEWVRGLRRRNGVSEIRGDPPHLNAGVVPEVVKFVWDDLISDAGAQILHHAYCAGAIVEGGAVRGILAETKAGRRAILAKRVIDATGDALVCHHAGVPWDQGDGVNKWAMALTKVFRVGGAPRPERPMDQEAQARMRAGLEAAIAHGEFTTPTMLEKNRFLGYAAHGLWRMPEPRDELLSVLSRVLKVDPLDPWDMTRAEREGRAQAWEAAEAYRRFVPGCERSFLADTSNHIGVRSSRRVRGLASVTDEDAIGFVTYADDIARSSWEIDVWPADSYGRTSVDRQSAEWKERAERMRAGAHFGIRYGCLVASGVDNLLMAGRCLSASHVAESSLRIQQTCQATGQAAGTAAAMSIRLGLTPRELDAMTLIAQLGKDRAAVAPAWEPKERLMSARA
jgi:2-polyprenyl-6-methoxyphenol hydroxylase-like FAD-dependent oxidoreductase